VTIWVSVHAYGAADADALVTDAAAPILAGRDWFFLRYWEGGPHVRIRVAAADPAEAAVVRARLHAGLGRWLAGHRGAPVLTQRAYAALAARLAGAEGRPTYDPELRPPGTVLDQPYEPEVGVYGTGATLAATERHFVESTALAVGILADGLPAGVRRSLALSAGLLTLADCEPDLATLAARFRAAGDVARAGRAGVADETAALLHAGYLESRRRLHLQVQQAWQLVSGDGGQANARLLTWLASVRRLRSVLEDAARRGEDADSSAPSPYAWYLSQLEPDRRAVGSILLRCTHLLVNRLGVPMDQEMQIAYLTARALADSDLPADATPRKW
jgi:Lantibiotic biosynthesis dehydratase C-term